MSAFESPPIDTDPTHVRRPYFDSVTICLHWATVLLVLAMFASALLRSQSQDDVSKTILLQIHRSLGLITWLVTGFRLAWRLTNAKLPPFPANVTHMHRASVYVSEYALYVLLLAQPVTGLGTTLFSGRPFALFLWQVPQLIAREETLWAVFHLMHELGAWALGTLAASHAAVALFHYLVLRDDVLQRMAPVITKAERRRKSTLPASGLFVATGNSAGPLYQAQFSGNKAERSRSC